MTTIKLNIYPTIGVEMLKFGMTPDEVSRYDETIGSPELSSESFGFYIEYRPEYTPRCEYRNNKLVSVGTAASARYDILLNDYNLYEVSPREAMVFLAEKNGGCKIDQLGDLVFDKLCIGSTGFYKKKSKKFYNKKGQDERSIGIYSPELIDLVLNDAVDFDVSEWPQ